MRAATRRYVAYEDARDIPNIVVDGSPNEATVLALTHWPGIPQPPGLRADLSAEMAFRYLEHPPPHEPAGVVTNNHFDQDGLVSLFALIRPDEACPHRDLLVDVAAAGDFGTYQDRNAARASMAIAALADPGRSPLGASLAGVSYAERCRLLYERGLELLVPLATEPERFRELWEDEDARLAASERAIREGVVRIDEEPDLDLAVVTIPRELSDLGGHRFGEGGLAELHPLALHNATECFRLLLHRGSHVRYVDRYETWVQYRARAMLPRVDLRPLAETLTADEPAGASWAATAPSEIAPTLAPQGGSSLPFEHVLEAVAHHLATAPPAWDPFSAGS